MNAPQTNKAHRPARPAANRHRTLAASSSMKPQCTRKHGNLLFPQRTDPHLPKQHPPCVVYRCRARPAFSAIAPQLSQNPINERSEWISEAPQRAARAYQSVPRHRSVSEASVKQPGSSSMRQPQRLNTPATLHHQSESHPIRHPSRKHPATFPHHPSSKRSAAHRRSSHRHEVPLPSHPRSGRTARRLQIASAHRMHPPVPSIPQKRLRIVAPAAISSGSVPLTPPKAQSSPSETPAATSKPISPGRIFPLPYLIFRLFPLDCSPFPQHLGCLHGF